MCFNGAIPLPTTHGAAAMPDLDLPQEVRVVNIPAGTSPRTITNITSSAPPLIHLYRAAALLATGAVIVTNVIAYNHTPPHAQDLAALSSSALALAAFGFLWLLSDFMSDVYRCRRLLEEIAKK